MTRVFLAFAAISVLVPAYAAESAGKAVFEKACQTCHGDAGEGNRLANQFFQVRIPHLGSKRVQSRSDAELRTIIVNGSGRMEPVRPAGGRPAVPHGRRTQLTDQQITEVIGYVRTLTAPAGR